MDQLKGQMHPACVRSLLDFFLCLKDITFRYCLSAANGFLRPDPSFFTLHLSSFLKIFKDTLHIVLRYAKFSSKNYGNHLIGAEILLYVCQTV